MALDTFAGGDALLHTDTPRARLSFQETLRSLMDCFDVLDDGALPGDLRDPGRLHRRRARPGHRLRHPLLQRRRLLRVQEINIGMTADLGVLQRLPKIVPPGRGARDGLHRRAHAAPSARWRSAWSMPCCPTPRRCRRTRWPLARSIAAKSPLAIAGSKLALNHARDHGTAAALAADGAAAERDLRHRRDGEAIAAWKDKATRRVRRARPRRRGARIGDQPLD